MAHISPVEQALREKICLIGKLMHQFRFIDGSAGNISARLDEVRILTTPSGLAKGFMQPNQLIIVDHNGQKVEDTPTTQHLRPTSELLMHLEAYKQRPDIGGVVHAHPPYAIALTLAGIPLQQWNIPEAIVFLGEIPTTPYATPSSAENRDAISQLIRVHDAIVLANHGSLTVAEDVWTAYLRLESLEHSAYITHLAAQLGGGKPLPEIQLNKLLEMRRSMGLERKPD